MRIQLGSSRLRLIAGLGALALAVMAPAARASVNLALSPALQYAAPGSDFDVFVDIPTAGSAFNGFHLVVSYDPAVLTPLPMAPTSAQQGCLMTGGCSDACGQTFHQFSAAGDSVVVGDVLLCNLVSITGPGHLYRLRFHASNTTQGTRVHIRTARFYDAGLLVTPVSRTDCDVLVGVATGVGDGGPERARPLRVEPNPAFGRVGFVSEDAQAGWAQADILDVQGRELRRLGPLWLGARQRLEWDGADVTGARAPAGLYVVRIRRGGGIQTARFVLLD